MRHTDPVHRIYDIWDEVGDFTEEHMTSIKEIMNKYPNLLRGHRIGQGRYEQFLYKDIDNEFEYLDDDFDEYMKEAKE